MELIQDIIRYTSRDDQLAFSLLSKKLRVIGLDAALATCTVDINGWKAVEEWQSLSDDFKNLVMGRCRSLSCTINNIPGRNSGKGGDNCANFFTQHWDQFKRVTSLGLATVYLANSKLIYGVQPRIKELTLVDCLYTLDGLATLVNTFPELTHLTLINITHSSSRNKKVPPLLPTVSPDSGRKLSIGDFTPGSFPVLNWILSVPWDDVSVLEGKKTSGHGLEIQDFIDGASANVKCLDLQEKLCCTYRDRPVILP